VLSVSFCSFAARGAVEDGRALVVETARDGPELWCLGLVPLRQTTESEGTLPSRSGALQDRFAFSVCSSLKDSPGNGSRRQIARIGAAHDGQAPQRAALPGHAGALRLAGSSASKSKAPRVGGSRGYTVRHGGWSPVDAPRRARCLRGRARTDIAPTMSKKSSRSLHARVRIIERSLGDTVR
jgi:hypothetical protein